MAFVTDLVSIQARGNTFGDAAIDWSVAGQTTVRRTRCFNAAHVLRVIKLSRKAGQP
jgi:hypothetical protein